MTNNRDISVQPFTSGADFENLRLNHGNNNSNFIATTADNGANGSLAHHNQSKLSRSPFGDGESRDNGTGGLASDNGASMALGSLTKPTATNDSSAPQSQVSSWIIIHFLFSIIPANARATL